MRLRFIPEYNIALASMPSSDKLEELSKEFRAVLVLAEPHELEYDLSEWERLGVKYLHIPVEDFSAPHLLDLYRGVRWIHDNISKGSKVLIHCLGGSGRSGTFASAYLVYRGLTAEKAIEKVREYILSAVETYEQEVMVKVFEFLIRALPEPKLAKVVDFGAKYDYGWGIGHASKVTQLALKLWHELTQELNLPKDTITPLAIAGILHDIGRRIGDGRCHHEKSYKEILSSEELKVILSEEELKLAALLTLHHRTKTGDPREDPRTPKELAEVIAKLAGILRVADALDWSLNQAVIDAEVQSTERKLNILVYASNRKCVYPNIEQALVKKSLLESVMKRIIDFTIIKVPY